MDNAGELTGDGEKGDSPEDSEVTGTGSSDSMVKKAQ